MGKGDPKDRRLLRLCEHEPENWRGARRELEAGADPGALSEWGCSGLTLLARSGEGRGVRAARELLEAGANPDGSGPEDRPLLEAAWQGDEGLCDLLLGFGADPEAAGPDGEDALDAALSRGQDAAADLLLRAGARASREAPLGPGRICAGLLGGAGDEILERLIAGGARVGRSGSGMLPIREAARRGRAAAARMLLESGADALERGEDGESALEAALRAYAGRGELEIREGVWRCVGLLAGWSGRWAWAPPDGASAYGRALSGRAVSGVGKLEDLARWGADPAAPDRLGRDALGWAALAPMSDKAALELAEWALDRGADPAREAACGRLPWQMARDSGKPRLAEMLLARLERERLGEGEAGGRAGKARAL